MWMIPIEEVEAMLDDIAAELPQEFFKYLNGGIILLPEGRYHVKSTGNDLFVMGEYRVDGHLGRYIAIYYGSFSSVYGHLPPDELKEKLRHTLKHEFRHHLESLAGEKDLEIKDAMDIAKYMDSKGRHIP
jgi:hypothetical protein